MKTLSDASAAVGGAGNNAKLKNIIHDFAEINAMGYTSNRQIRALTNNGIAANKYLADALGVSEAAVFDMAKKRQISAAEGMQAILYGMNKQF